MKQEKGTNERKTRQPEKSHAHGTESQGGITGATTKKKHQGGKRKGGRAKTVDG